MPMREINLQEHQPSGCPHPLSAVERAALEGAAKVDIKPGGGADNAYILTPSSTIGALAIGDLSALIEPKIGIPQALSLACYATGKIRFRDDDFRFPDERALPDILALALARQARRAFARGLLQGYRSREDTLYTVRGRIRFDDQLRRRFSIPLPVEARYDEFTADILANRLVKAAAYRLRAMRLRSAKASRGLAWLAAILEDVSLAEFPPGRVPELPYDRLNEHYRGVVELARLALRHSAFQLQRGAVRAAGFLMDMNAVFQEFVTRALRDALNLSAHTFRSDRSLKGDKRITLDEAGRIGLEPDLSWWDSAGCVFVGDAKYKNLAGGSSVPNADLYQMLAYATALDLPGGLLIYAAGEAGAMPYRVRYAGKTLKVATLDLRGALDDALARVDKLAQMVVALRQLAR